MVLAVGGPGRDVQELYFIYSIPRLCNVSAGVTARPAGVVILTSDPYLHSSYRSLLTSNSLDSTSGKLLLPVNDTHIP